MSTSAMMRRLACAAFACGAALAACNTTNAPVPGPAANVTAQGPKPELSGLLDMGTINFYTKDEPAPFSISDIDMFPGSFGGFVINATWAELQPTDAPRIASGNVIDGALAEIEAYNATHPHVYAKLRVWGGNTAPLWAKSLNGVRGGIVITDPKKGSLSFGEWWTPQYIAKWRTLQALLAQRYDANPLIRAVAVTSCASLTDEPFVGEFEPPESDVLAHYGYTDAAQESCLLGAIDDYAPWKSTPIDYAFNLFHKVALSTPAHGVSPADPAFTLAVMNACRRELGALCTFDNHALQCPPPSGDQFVYTQMQTAKGSIDFQTASPPVLHGNIVQAVETGAYYGAHAIELWPDTEGGFPGFTDLPPSLVAQLAQIVAKGSNQPICPIPTPTSTALAT